MPTEPRPRSAEPGPGPDRQPGTTTRTPEGARLEEELPLIVLDTNVVFEWLIFAGPSCAPLQNALERRQIRWIATPRMFEEFFHVIARGTLDAWAPDPAALLGAWHDHCSIVVAPAAPSPSGLRCSDPDDQIFIDLAVARQAHWLLSKDRAVLRLAARLAVLGVRSLSPTAWARLQTAASDADPDAVSADTRSCGAVPTP